MLWSCSSVLDLVVTFVAGPSQGLIFCNPDLPGFSGGKFGALPDRQHFAETVRHV